MEKVREHLLCYSCKLWTMILLRSDNVLTKLFIKPKPVLSKIKLTRNKNARHIFPRHFLTVAMIGIKFLCRHFVLYIFHTRSLFFNYLHYFRSYDNHCKKCTCTSCAPTTRLFDAKFVFEIAFCIRLKCQSQFRI